MQRRPVEVHTEDTERNHTDTRLQRRKSQHLLRDQDYIINKCAKPRPGVRLRRYVTVRYGTVGADAPRMKR